MRLREPDHDWRQIAALYSELLRFDPSPVIEANRAIAVAYAEGPAAGLAILDTLAASSRLARWARLHVARAALLAQCGRHADAVAAYRDALELEPMSDNLRLTIRCDNLRLSMWRSWISVRSRQWSGHGRRARRWTGLRPR